LERCQYLCTETFNLLTKLAIVWGLFKFDVTGFPGQLDHFYFTV
jgi:hypothetical protein